MNTERVKTFFAMLSGIPDERLGWGEWRSSPNGDTFSEVTDRNLLERKESVADPVGWACAYPEFREQSLHFYRCFPKYKDSVGWKAVAAFFDFSPSDLRCIFGQAYEIENKADILSGTLYVLYREGAINKARYDLLKENLNEN